MPISNSKSQNQFELAITFLGKLQTSNAELNMRLDSLKTKLGKWSRQNNSTIESQAILASISAIEKACLHKEERQAGVFSSKKEHQNYKISGIAYLDNVFEVMDEVSETELLVDLEKRKACINKIALLSKKLDKSATSPWLRLALGCLWLPAIVLGLVTAAAWMLGTVAQIFGPQYAIIPFLIVAVSGALTWACAKIITLIESEIKERVEINKSMKEFYKSLSTDDNLKIDQTNPNNSHTKGAEGLTM